MLDFGISHRWAVSPAIKCQFFICQKLRRAVAEAVGIFGPQIDTKV